MNAPSIWCTVHQIHYADACPQCEAAEWAECTKVSIDGIACEPCDALRRARRVAGKSQAMVVREAGLSRHTVAKWEAGRQFPRLDLWLRALNACGYRVRVEKDK